MRTLIAAASLTLALMTPAHGEPAVAAIGLSGAWQARQDFGAGERSAVATELIGFVYTPLAGRLHLRPGLRIGFVGLDQAEMPRAVRLEERDLATAVELGLVFDGPVVPSLTVGGGMLIRFLDLELAAPVTAREDPLSRTQIFAAVHAQLGLGFPIASGRLLFEPFLRWEHVFGDDRIGWRLGAELTVTIF